MKFEIGIENNFEGHSLAWILGHPGCYSTGVDGPAALAAVPQAIAEYSTWIATRNNGTSWVDGSQIELAPAEQWEVYSINEQFDLAETGYEVNAWFHHDWKPLTELEIERALQLLSWTRADLLSVVANLDNQALHTTFPGERWPIGRILQHVGGSEWWYLDRLGLGGGQESLLDDPLERLAFVRGQMIEVLPRLGGSTQVVGVDGEFWSPRKVVRRAVWHERDHTEHIRKLKKLL